MSKGVRGLILAGAIIALCLGVLFVITSIMNLTGIGLTIELIKAGAGFTAIFNLIRIIFTAVLAVLILVYSILLCLNPDKTGNYAQYFKKVVLLIVFISIMMFIELLGIIILFDILAIVDIIFLTTSMVLLCVGLSNGKKELGIVAKSNSNVITANGGTNTGANVNTVANSNQVQTFDCDLDNLIDHKVYRIRQLHADGIFTDEEMKQLLIEVFTK